MRGSKGSASTERIFRTADLARERDASRIDSSSLETQQATVAAERGVTVEAAKQERLGERSCESAESTIDPIRGSGTDRTRLFARQERRSLVVNDEIHGREGRLRLLDAGNRRSNERDV